MMFHGTYVSDFYRSVRDLLHARITADKLATDRGDERCRAIESLQNRWDSLIAHEHIFRRDAGAAVAVS